MAKYEKGQSGNPEGKPKGAKNKRTKTWELFVEHCMTGGLEKFQAELELLDGPEYVKAFMALLEFHQPKLARTELTGEDGTPLIPTKTDAELIAGVNRIINSTKKG